VRVPATGGADLGAGRTEEPFSEPLSGLAPGTWFVCAIAENAAGVATGEVVTFVVSDEDTDAGDTDDTDAGDTDFGETDETDAGDTSSDGGGVSPGCGCASSSPAPGGLGVVLLGVAGAVLRRRRLRSR
jgi:MYXO-CTERM domain-containing protein